MALKDHLCQRREVRFKIGEDFLHGRGYLKHVKAENAAGINQQQYHPQQLGGKRAPNVRIAFFGVHNLPQGHGRRAALTADLQHGHGRGRKEIFAAGQGLGQGHARFDHVGQQQHLAPLPGPTLGGAGANCGRQRDLSLSSNSHGADEGPLHRELMLAISQQAHRNRRYYDSRAK